MFALRKSKARSSSRSQIGIKGINDGILILPNNSYRAVLEVSSVNFELKSEDEQDAIIETYESFLNSVGTSLQILIRTREIDMDKYLSDLKERLESEAEPVYMEQLKNYEEFIKSLILSNKILTRRFYVIVPYSNVGKLDFELIKEQLGLTVDVVAKGMNRLGMQVRQLSSIEALDLFYSFYNPQQAKIQPLTEKAIHMIYTALIQKEEKGAKL
ncbi:conjugal transfer protein TraC [Candidatus Roizmanbacteria bacterium]|nr:conjugal transfer protein TraC [Candidatus Roizmanbacteria bacterium]